MAQETPAQPLECELEMPEVTLYTRKIKTGDSSVELAILGFPGSHKNAGKEHALVITTNSSVALMHGVCKVFCGNSVWATVVLPLYAHVHHVERRVSSVITTDAEIALMQTQLVYKCESAEIARNYGEVLVAKGDMHNGLHVNVANDVYHAVYRNGVCCLHNVGLHPVMVTGIISKLSVTLNPGEIREVTANFDETLQFVPCPKIFKSVNLWAVPTGKYLPIKADGTVNTLPISTSGVTDWIHIDQIQPITLNLSLIDDDDGSHISLADASGVIYQYDLASAKKHVLPHMIRGHLYGSFKYAMIQLPRNKACCVPVLSNTLSGKNYDCELCSDTSDSESE